MAEVAECTCEALCLGHRTAVQAFLPGLLLELILSLQKVRKTKPFRFKNTTSKTQSTARARKCREASWSHLAVSAKEDILWRDVAVHHLVFVKMGEATQELLHVASNFLDGHEFAARSCHVLVQVSLVPVIHQDAFAGTNIQDAHQVRVWVRFDALVNFLINLAPAPIF